MEKIIKEFESFMLTHGTHYNQFYVGIAANPETRLRDGHNVDHTIPNIYWSSPIHTDIVRSIEKYFLEKGSKGGPGGGDNNTVYIYAYFITSKTQQ
jgi:hypothetical protein